MKSFTPVYRWMKKRYINISTDWNRIVWWRVNDKNINNKRESLKPLCEKSRTLCLIYNKYESFLLN